MKFDNVIAKREGKTIFRDENKAIKVFNKNYSKADILNEALNSARVEETEVNVPKLLAVTTIDNKWAIVTEFIEGKSLATLMNENPAMIDKYLEDFVNLQISVHNQKAPMLSVLKEKMHRKISSSSFDATIRYDLHTRLNSLNSHTKVCHGDFNPSNIIIRDDGVPYILDWSHATQGNASADVARTYLIFMVEGKTDIAEKYLELYCKKSDTAKQYVQKWIPIVACSESIKNKPSELEILKSWVEVVDYQ